MEKFFKRKSGFDLPAPIPQEHGTNEMQHISKISRVEIDLSKLPSDPGSRPPISSYHPNVQDSIRRRYLQNGPCQPRRHIFPQTKFGNNLRRFNKEWFTDHKGWLEYSESKDAAFCFYCYLFRPSGGEKSGHDVFILGGFRNWKTPSKLQTHVGDCHSSHNKAYIKCEGLKNQEQHVSTLFHKQSIQAQIDYRVQLTVVVNCIRFLLCQGLAFRGHDESGDSCNRGNFLELLKYTADHNDTIKAVLENAPLNLQLTSPDIQKDIVNAAAVETVNAILNDLGNSLFAILIDESRDISIKEQMAVVLRYVDSQGYVIECFLGIMHVHETTSIALKIALEELFSKYNLSIMSLRGQGYDGASNMQGEFNGLKALILKENKSAYYIHCFAHQLQLALVAVAKHHPKITLLFNIVSSAVNIVGASCKRRDVLRDKHADNIIRKIESGELLSGQGQNQETSLKRSGETRWGSHYGTLINLIVMFASVIDLLDIVVKDGSSSEQRGEAYALLESMQSFDFIMSLHLMRSVLGVTNELSKALQREDQDIVNAICLVNTSKKRLQSMRDNGWDLLLREVSSFCVEHIIHVPQMDASFVARGRSRRRTEVITNLHHYRAELFYTCIDMQLQELNNRFDEVNSELLLCMACLNPVKSFLAFDKQKIIRLSQFYPNDFTASDRMVLQDQLETYIMDVKSNAEFFELDGLGTLAKKMVESKKDIVYPLVYLLIKLSLILPVATATVERAFSAMHLVKNRLRNRMGDDWLNDLLVTYIEKDIFKSIENEVIMQRFQNMKDRRGKLSLL